MLQSITHQAGNMAEQEKGITVQQLYDHIVKQITPEEALKRLLSSSLLTYEKLKFPEGQPPVHPVFVMTMAAMDMGWGFLIPANKEEITGMVTGTEEYLNDVYFKSDNNESRESATDSK